MISPIQPTSGRAAPPVYQLKVVLTGSKPAVWRRVPVPGNANLGWLQAVLTAQAFDLAKANTWLGKLKWPRLTEAQLRKVLMGRDDDRG